MHLYRNVHFLQVHHHLVDVRAQPSNASVAYRVLVMDKPQGEDMADAVRIDQDDNANFPPPSLLTTIPTEQTTMRMSTVPENVISRTLLSFRRMPIRRDKDRGSDDCGVLGETALEFFG